MFGIRKNLILVLTKGDSIVLSKDYFTKAYNLLKAIGDNNDAQEVMDTIIYETYVKPYVKQ
jgi:hypothetical protein